VRRPVLLSWSGGKDCALALHELRRSPDFEVVGLLTTFLEGEDRTVMHRVRRELIERQAESAGLPLRPVPLPPEPSNPIYEARVGAALEEARREGIRHVAFGDLFLEDIRAWRERQMAALGFEPVFPVWDRDTASLARRFLALGFRAILVCVDTAALDAAFAGRSFDEELLRDLPPGVDPCGENGELHTFVHDGPVFRQPVPVRVGNLNVRGRFAYRDLTVRYGA
jgi:uncharacterized protein (TIGR00290 family)